MNVVFDSAAAAKAKVGGSTRPSWGRRSNTFIIIHLHRCIHIVTTTYSMGSTPAQIFLGFSLVLTRGGSLIPLKIINLGKMFLIITAW